MEAEAGKVPPAALPNAPAAAAAQHSTQAQEEAVLERAAAIKVHSCPEVLSALLGRVHCCDLKSSCPV